MSVDPIKQMQDKAILSTPAVFANVASVTTGAGTVRITFGETLGGSENPMSTYRMAVLMDVHNAAEFAGLLLKAIEAARAVGDAATNGMEMQ